MSEDKIVIAHWPGNDTPACREHLSRLVGLAAILGFMLNWTPAPEGATCSNCESERRKLVSA